MLSSITFGQFMPGDSLLHRLDPRTKVVGVLAVAASVLAAANWIGFALVAGLTLVAVLQSQLPAKVYISGLRAFWVIFAITFIVQAFLTPGEILAGLGPLKITQEGLETGGRIFLRLALLVLVASLLTLTTPPVNLAAGLESMLSPLKRLGVPAHELAMMMTIALRFVPILLQEAETLVRAQRSRGAAFVTGGPAGWARGLLPLFVPLFAGALRRAEDLATAMEARSYRGGANMTRMMSLRFGLPDYVVLTLTAVVLAGVVASRFL